MYQIKIQAFEGPLSLLLKLIEQEKLDITNVSLSQIADQYLARIEGLGEKLSTAELADFLVMATRLLLITSHVLLPSSVIENEEIGDLEHQLKMYKAYKDAADRVRAMIANNRFSFSRHPIKLAREVEFSPPKKLSARTLAAVLQNLIKELQKTMIRLPKKTLRKVLSLTERISHLREILRTVQKIGFKDFIKSARNKAEVVVSFLALLELAKQRHLAAEQAGDDILVTRNNK